MKALDTIVTGIVWDESGLPLSGTTVYILAGTGSWLDIAALTNARGEFQLSGMDSGRYVLSVCHENFVSENLEIEIGEVPYKVNVTLKRQ